MTYSIIELNEKERKAYSEGDTEKAEIIAQLIQVKQALEDLTESGDNLATILERESKNSPDFIESGYAIINLESDYFTDFVNAVSDAQQAIED